MNSGKMFYCPQGTLQVCEKNSKFQFLQGMPVLEREELLGGTRMGIKRAIFAMVALSINVN